MGETITKSSPSSRVGPFSPGLSNLHDPEVQNTVRIDIGGAPGGPGNKTSGRELHRSQIERNEISLFYN